ncbi:MAG: hypothetical protein KJ000_08280 [Pirellulaceae bacterium]|nr:hypothetical protein [Pirellulaceae bacterium]
MTNDIKDGFTSADNPYASPLRQWIYRYLDREFPVAKTYRSDQGEEADIQKFETWTQCTQRKDRADKFKYKYLPDIWAGKATFSTCTSFVAILVTRIKQHGGVKGGPVFQTFNLSLNKKGWNTYPNAEKSPEVGDIFAVGSPSNMKHVGVILNSVGKLWITVEAGGGLIGQYQSITRSGWHPPNPGICGWIDIDEYFDTWSDKSRT